MIVVLKNIYFIKVNCFKFMRAVKRVPVCFHFPLVVLSSRVCVKCIARMYVFFLC